MLSVTVFQNLFKSVYVRSETTSGEILARKISQSLIHCCGRISFIRYRCKILFYFDTHRQCFKSSCFCVQQIFMILTVSNALFNKPQILPSLITLCVLCRPWMIAGIFAFIGIILWAILITLNRAQGNRSNYRSEIYSKHLTVFEYMQKSYSLANKVHLRSARFS